LPVEVPALREVPVVISSPTKTFISPPQLCPPPGASGSLPAYPISTRHGPNPQVAPPMLPCNTNYAPPSWDEMRSQSRRTGAMSSRSATVDASVYLRSPHPQRRLPLRTKERGLRGRHIHALDCLPRIPALSPQRPEARCVTLSPRVRQFEVAQTKLGCIPDGKLACREPHAPSSFLELPLP